MSKFLMLILFIAVSTSFVRADDDLAALKQQLSELRQENETLKRRIRELEAETKSREIASPSSKPATASNSFAELMEKARISEISEIENSIKTTTEKLSSISRSTGTPKEKETNRAILLKRLADDRKRLAQLKANTTGSSPTIDPFSIKLGQFGKLNLSDDVLLEYDGTSAGKTSRYLKVLQITGNDTMLVAPVRNNPTRNGLITGKEFIVQGISTQGIVNSQHITDFNYYFQVVDTKTYPSADGATNTVFLLKNVPN